MPRKLNIHSSTAAINETLSSRGGFYAGYSAKRVSWDDASRGTVGNLLSSWGPNITDTYLSTKSGDPLYTVRCDNWNEKLGFVSADKISLLVGNCDRGGVRACARAPLRPVTLEGFLKQPAAHGAAYTGMSPTATLYDRALDEKVSIRFQTVFLPLEKEDSVGSADRCRIQFAASAYNYNTMCDDHPRNVVLLASSQGLTVTADGAGSKRMFHHARPSRTGPAQSYWLEAEATQHQVGKAQKETSDEREDAERRGKATSGSIGIRAMGKRFNALLTVQVPLQVPSVKARGKRCRCVMLQHEEEKSDSSPSKKRSRRVKQAPYPKNFAKGQRKQLACKSARSSTPQAVGRSSAARVSRGDIVKTVKPLPTSEPIRNRTEHVTVTVVIYHAVEGGVPAAKEVCAAVEELEELYASCESSGKLADPGFNFTTKPLSAKDCVEIFRKVSTEA